MGMSFLSFLFFSFLFFSFLFFLFFYASSCRVPAEFTVVGMFVPLVINEFAIVIGGGGVKVECTRFASMTCVGAPEVS